MKEFIDMVEQFHTAFNQDNAEKPINVSPDVAALRFDLIFEESREYLDACKSGSVVDIADALGDQLYIIYGTILKHGLQDKMEDIFKEIHRSNMSKLDKNGFPIYREDGKILKGPFYFKPDILSVLNKK
jgi:predicted HAD superfamily Cof-like phosphohydrolase